MFVDKWILEHRHFFTHFVSAAASEKDQGEHRTSRVNAELTIPLNFKVRMMEKEDDYPACLIELGKQYADELAENESEEVDIIQIPGRSAQEVIDDLRRQGNVEFGSTTHSSTDGYSSVHNFVEDSDSALELELDCSSQDDADYNPNDTVNNTEDSLEEEADKVPVQKVEVDKDPFLDDLVTPEQYAKLEDEELDLKIKAREMGPKKITKKYVKKLVRKVMVDDVGPESDFEDVNTPPPDPPKDPTVMDSSADLDGQVSSDDASSVASKSSKGSKSSKSSKGSKKRRGRPPASDWRELERRMADTYSYLQTGVLPNYVKSTHEDGFTRKNDFINSANQYFIDPKTQQLKRHSKKGEGQLHFEAYQS